MSRPSRRKWSTTGRSRHWRGRRKPCKRRSESLTMKLNGLRRHTVSKSASSKRSALMKKPIIKVGLRKCKTRLRKCWH